VLWITTFSRRPGKCRKTVRSSRDRGARAEILPAGAIPCVICKTFSARRGDKQPGVLRAETVADNVSFGAPVIDFPRRGCGGLRFEESERTGSRTFRNGTAANRFAPASGFRNASRHIRVGRKSSLDPRSRLSATVSGAQHSWVFVAPPGGKVLQSRTESAPAGRISRARAIRADERTFSAFAGPAGNMW